MYVNFKVHRYASNVLNTHSQNEPKIVSNTLS
jgi:hypothetical protein